MSRSTSQPATAGSPAYAGTLGIVSNAPNPARLYESLRDSGYSNEAAVADLIDNCVDGEATRIRISLSPESGKLVPEQTRLVIADDGRGMPLEVLKEAMKLGSQSGHDLASDLGKYGMGLITAAISIGRRLRVITKTREGNLLSAIHDLDVIMSRNEFLVEIRDGDVAADALWAEYAVSPLHGTIVIIDNCDQLAYVHAGSLVSRLKQHVGQVFRLFIVAKSKPSAAADEQFDSFISINDAPVFAEDPLMLEENKDFLFPRTRDLLSGRFSEQIETFRIPVSIDPRDPDGDKDELMVTIVQLPEVSPGLARDLGFNALNEGVYVLRNQREIAPAQTLGLFARAQGLTNFRAELHVPATLDKRIGINWTKQRVEPDDQLLEELRKRIGPHVASVRKQYVKKTTADRTVEHKSYETLISKKAKLLDLPKVRTVVRKKRGVKTGTVEPKYSAITRSGNGQVSERMRDRCVFREGAMTASGPLWEPDMEGTKIVITFNTDHPLWTKFVVDSSANENALIELLHLLSFCMSSAEFNAFTEEEFYERLVNMRQLMSNNMRVLLT